MSSKGTLRMRVSETQKEIMVSFMEVHREMAAGKTSSQYTKRECDQHWRHLSRTLNASKGCAKTVNQWRKTWTDLKMEAKRKARRNKIGAEGALSPMQLRVLCLVGTRTDYSYSCREESHKNDIDSDTGGHCADTTNAVSDDDAPLVSKTESPMSAIPDDEAIVFYVGDADTDCKINHRLDPLSVSKKRKKKSSSKLQSTQGRETAKLDTSEGRDRDKFDTSEGRDRDKFDTFGRHVAMVLRSLPPLNAISAKDRISTLLTEEEIKVLDPTITEKKDLEAEGYKIVWNTT